MKVYLAGFNVDASVLQELEESCGKRQDLTPEVISAAYARISRDPRPINEIRQMARVEVERSRKSNSTIIFKMGHHSVAEHAVFNLDILGVSRYAMEELEKFRLSSYTEKSQRYITLDKDFVIPSEIKGSDLEKLFVATIKEQNKAYFELYEKLKEHVFNKHPDLASDPKKHNLLEGWAKEDARYITALATESQVGQTINARNLELMLRRFASSGLSEINTLGRMIYDEISQVAPSIVIFHEANDRDLKTYPQLKTVTDTLLSSANLKESSPSESLVQLVEFNKDTDALIAAALLHTCSNITYEQCREVVGKLTHRQLKKVFDTAYKNMQFYDSMLREFEYANLTYNIVLSAACFGQMKRHRMSTITTQRYDPNLGATIPESIEEVGMKGKFLEIVDRTNETYGKLCKKQPLIAPYILTNAHRRRILMRLNPRELYHISRLREDTHAQWDIQNVSRQMSAEARRVMPLTFSLVGGKDQYNDLYQDVFGQLPKITKAALPGTRKISN